MDHTHIGGDMSPLYVPRKRRSVQSQQKSGVPCPIVRRMPERACELSVIGPAKNDGSQAQDASKMKRSYGRKRYEIQSISIGTEDFPTTSCSVMASGALANGAGPVSLTAGPVSLTAPAARLPPRLVGKDVWPQQGQEPSRESRSQAQEQSWNTSRERGAVEQAWGATGRDRAQDQAWNSGRDRVGHSGQDQTWMAGRERTHGGADQAWVAAGRERAPEQAWATSRDRAQDQAWNPGRDPGRDRAPSGPEQGWNTPRGQDQSWSSASRGQDPVWRPDLATKKVQRVEMDRSPPVNSFPQAPDARDCGSDPVNFGGTTEASTAQPSEELKTPLFSTKKEPPTYPPGSPEERWQLQIVAKGRVNCPKCKSVSRKTVEGLKKHMENCRLQPFTCQHCGKQLKSSTGMKYHIMADHSHLPSPDDANALDDKQVKEKLRKILKRLGKLKCSKEGCSAGFTSIMGYVYHMKKCGKAQSELEKLVLNCSHCGKAYRSRAGLEYHLRSEHAPTPQRNEEEDALKRETEASPERTASGRVQRASAQVANFHLAEIASNELPKDWPKRKFQSDLVPEDHKLMFVRPSLPAFSQEVLRKWKNEVKLQRKVQCPNQDCGCIYTSVSGLKAHLGICTKGDFEAGKYRCLICNKEFNSESGVKYHINSVHSQEWFVTNKKASKKFEKFLKNQPKECVHGVDRQIIQQYHQHHLHHHHVQHQHHHQQHHHHHQHHHQQLHQHQQLQAIQQPLQPLHHLQHQVQVHHTENYITEQHHHPAPIDTQLQPLLSYTPLEPPVVGSMWVDMDRRVVTVVPEQSQVDLGLPGMDKSSAGESSSGMSGDKRREKGGVLERVGERGKLDAGKRKDCFAFGGGGAGSGGSGSNTGSSSSESEVEQAERQRQMEVEQVERQRQIDQWNLKRPGVMEGNSELAKRQRNA